MKYENPTMEITKFIVGDVICTSNITGEQGGNGDDVTGPWG